MESNKTLRERKKQSLREYLHQKQMLEKNKKFRKRNLIEKIKLKNREIKLQRYKRDNVVPWG